MVRDIIDSLHVPFEGGFDYESSIVLLSSPSSRSHAYLRSVSYNPARLDAQGLVNCQVLQKRRTFRAGLRAVISCEIPRG